MYKRQVKQNVPDVKRSHAVRRELVATGFAEQSGLIMSLTSFGKVRRALDIFVIHCIFVFEFLARPTLLHARDKIDYNFVLKVG